MFAQSLIVIAAIICFTVIAYQAVVTNVSQETVKWLIPVVGVILFFIILISLCLMRPPKSEYVVQ